MKFVTNLNDNVSVRLTPEGEAVWANYYSSDGTSRGVPDYVQKEIGGKRWIRFQLYHLMQVFGPQLYVGMHEPLFVDNDVRFE